MDTAAEVTITTQPENSKCHIVWNHGLIALVTRAYYGGPVALNREFLKSQEPFFQVSHLK